MKNSMPVVLMMLLLGAGRSAAQTVVNSLSELQAHLGDNNAHIVMTPGTYRIAPDDVTSGQFTNATLLTISGTNSVFDFTDVEIEVDTDLFQSFGSVQVIEVAVWGQSNTLKNLTLTDLGSTRPSKTALNVLLDGRDNTVEGFNVTVRGSYPYGYGDIFGKGSGSVIGHKKHSAILVRGDRSLLKDCNVFQRSYGHAIFAQGALDAVIEGCYVEGEMRTTDEVLAEAGTGSAADDVDFMTVWGWTLTPGSMFSTLEEGIRAYSGGTDPDGNTRGCINLTVKDCTVKNARGGVSIGWTSGTKYIEGCVTIDCEGAYWPGSNGQIVESAGNAAYAPLLLYFFEGRGGSVVDLTLVDNENRYGNDELLYIIGEGHDVTIRSRDGYVQPDMRVMASGIRSGHRIDPSNAYNNLAAQNNTINNQSQYALELSTNSFNNGGQSAGPVSDWGSGNNISPISNHTAGGFSVLQIVRGEYFSAQNGISVHAEGEMGSKILNIQDGDWLRFDDYFFGSGPNRFEARVVSGSGGTIELRLDAVDGELIGTCAVPASTTSNAWNTVAVSLNEPRGKHDVYLVFTGGAGELMELDAFKFDVLFPGHTPKEWYAPTLVGHWKFDTGSGSVAVDSSGLGHHGTLENSSWVVGMEGHALAFNGNSSQVILPPEAFETVEEQITIAMWVYGDGSQPHNNSLLRANTASGNRAVNIHLPYGDAQVYWQTGTASGGYEQIYAPALEADFKGVWTHWVFTKDIRFSQGLMNIYRNGQLWLGSADRSEPVPDVAEAVIGSWIGGGFYKGLIDEVRLYNVALTATAVEELYRHYSEVKIGEFSSNQEVGAPAESGSASYLNGVYTVEGGGSDILGTSDQFYFVSGSHTGDGELATQVTSVENTHPWAKAGPMFRESTEAGSKNVFIAVRPDHQISMQVRETTGGSTEYEELVGGTDVKWVKLIRTGDLFTGLYSADGESWTEIATTTIRMPDDIERGFAVTSHDDSSLCMAKFNMVPPAPSGLTAEAFDAAQIDLVWNPAVSATAYNLKRATTSGGSYVIATNELTITNHRDTGLSAGTNYFYIVCGEYLGMEGDSSIEVSSVPSALIDPDQVVIGTVEIVDDSSGGHDFSLSITTSVLGHHYRIWTTKDLVAPDWQDRSGIRAGNGALLQIDIPMNPEEMNLFYKLDAWRQ
ncbi:MAG: carbohydrate-binding protein [Pontiella sp.]